MPSLPAVALDEAEAARVGGQPAVGGFRAEIELRGTAVQRVPRRGDPGRVGMSREERRLFGVGAETGDDEEADAVGSGGGGHAVKAFRDVRPHALAVAIDK